MCMPRLSLYKPEKGKDYSFLDKQISEMFTVGGTDVFVHKYIGTDDGVTQKDHTQIQDMLFLENRDRKYDEDIYNIRGIYNVQDIDFDLSQFGLFLSNDTLFMTIHINSSVKTLGRKIMPGDVIELPHLKDEYAANDLSIALKRFYVVEDVNRAAEGFSPTWYPHLYRLKLKQLVDSQEFADILDKPASEDTDTTLRDLLSTKSFEDTINEAIVAEAEAEAPKSGYSTTNFYTMAVDEETGRAKLQTADEATINASTTLTADVVEDTPTKLGYDGYLIGDSFAPNGSNFGSGISFPTNSAEGDYYLRTDFLPQRLFRFDGRRWVKVHDVNRETMTNTSTRNTQKASFFNNTDVWSYSAVTGNDTFIATAGQFVIDTELLPTDNITAKYVVFRLMDETGYVVKENAYVTADNTGLLSLYDDNGTDRVRVTLPLNSDNAQQTLDAGIWRVTFANDRVAERQSLTQALRPRADI
jgi:hypothetical protein